MSTSRYARPLDLSDRNSAHTLGILSVPPGSRVLDVGAADGSAARGLVERGCQVWAVEIDIARAREAEAACERVVVADVEGLDLDAAFGGMEFDAVLLLDVLEHLRDPLTVLRECGRVVRDDGRLVLSVPNVAHAAVKLALLEGRFQYTDVGLLDRTHLRFFDRAGVNQLVADAGLLVEEELRTTAGAAETEIPIDPSSFAPAVVAAATEDPESNTYQFVLVVKPDPAAQSAAQPATRMRAPGPVSEARLQLLHQDLRLKEAYIANLRNELAERDVREQSLQKAASGYRHELAVLERSSSWRMTAPLRALMSRVRGRRS